jgi:hypothetical protein
MEAAVDDLKAKLVRPTDPLQLAVEAMTNDSAALVELLDFLQGTGPLEGVHFGDEHPTRRGAFWWRTILSERAATITALQARVAELEQGLSKVIGALIQIEVHTDCGWAAPIAGKATAEARATLGDAT